MKKYGTAEDRWAGVGPYYAMFPASFANRVITRYSGKGDVVLDPFAGRGTAVFSAVANGRVGIGIEINPVGWVYAQAKLRAARKSDVERRLTEIGKRTERYRESSIDLPNFFRRCYHLKVLQFLVAARAELDWKNSVIDRTLMALLLVHLHGKKSGSFSNQMRQTKSMSARYAIQWWTKHQSRAPILDPVEFMRKRLQWRYAKGIPSGMEGSRIYLGDSVNLLARLANHIPRQASLLFTSPPYYGVTNYHYDQWLRLWLLGEPPTSRQRLGKHRARFANATEYSELLVDVFSGAASATKRNATIYVRTGRDAVTYKATRDALKAVFPRHNISRMVRPFVGPTQTHLFGDLEPKLGEVDLLLTR